MIIFAVNTVALAQLVRVAVCGTAGHGFEPHKPPTVKQKRSAMLAFFIFVYKLFIWSSYKRYVMLSEVEAYSFKPFDYAQGDILP